MTATATCWPRSRRSRTARRCRSPRSRSGSSSRPWTSRTSASTSTAASTTRASCARLLDDIKAGHVVQGASTIEQQLVRNLYLNDSQTFTRKIKEAWLANQMAQDWSKDKILGTYLNVVPYGGVTYGCEAAAETYFNEHCSALNIRQAALIAGLPQSPTDYNPRLHPNAALARRNEVLAAMLDQSDITLAQYQTAVGKGLGLQAPKRFTRVRQPYFVQYVRNQLRQKYGSKMVRGGGLKVTTTIDPTLQAAAHQAMVNVLSFPNAPAAALVAVDPRNGEILAMQSSTDYSDSKYNLAVQSKRQAGSTFKSYGLLAAMVDDHIDPNTTDYSTAPLVNQPIVPFPTPGDANDYWNVQNAESATRLGAAALDRARGVGERRLRAACDRHRRPEGGQHGLQARHPPLRPPAAVAVGDPGRRRRLAARHDPRLRDDRRHGRAPAAAGGHQGGAVRAEADPDPGRRRTRATGCSRTAPPGSSPSTSTRTCTPAAPARTRTSSSRASPTGPRRARPAPPTTTPTPGSAATRPTWPPASGSATPRASSRCSTWAGRSRARRSAAATRPRSGASSPRRRSPTSRPSSRRRRGRSRR